MKQCGNPDGLDFPRMGAESLVVQGTAFANSAAKFWSALIDELCADYPECDEVVLDTLTDTDLSRELLFPTVSLQNSIDRPKSLEDIRRSIQQAMADFELMGPPDSVRARLFIHDKERKSCSLPFDCVDADIFPFLLVWLLEWSETPECLWNDKHVAGEFNACDRDKKTLYSIRFALTNEHVSEGLFKRMVAVRYKRSSPEKMPGF